MERSSTRAGEGVALTSYQSGTSGAHQRSRSRMKEAPNSPPASPALKKELTLINGVAFVAGNIIGSGIFISPNIVVRYSGSFGLSISLWLLGAIVAVVCALCYCELGTFVKKCGGESAYILKAYTFKTRGRSLGSLLAFLFVWTSIFIIRPASIAVISIVFAEHLSGPVVVFIGSEIPGPVVKLIALSLLVVVTALNCYSVKLLGRVVTVFTAAKLLACAFIVVVGFSHVISQGQLPPAFHHPFEGTTHSISSVAIALFGVLWAFDGWNAVGYTAEEMQNVEQNLPRAAIIGIFVVIAVYIPMNLAYFFVLSYNELVATDAVGVSFGQNTLGVAGLVIIPLFVAISTFGSLNSSFFNGSRIILSSARDGLLPDALSGVHRTFKTPNLAVLLLSSLSFVYIMIGDIDELVNGISAGVWLFYGLTIAGLLIMRVTHKDEPRPYRVWLIAPVFALLVCLYLVLLPVIQKPVPTLMAFGTILLGLPVYVFLVMETPWKLRPELFDRVSQSLSIFSSTVLNSQSSRSRH